METVLSGVEKFPWNNIEISHFIKVDHNINYNLISNKEKYKVV